VKSTNTKLVPAKNLQELIKINDEKLQLEKSIPALVQEEIQKVETLNRNEAMRYRLPYRINDTKDPDRKPGADVPFSYLRRIAVLYPIARACINRRVRQITQLEWDITTIDEVKDEKGYAGQIKAVKDFLKQPMGHKTRMREMLTLMVDDVLTIDAVCFEMQRTRGGDFLNLVPVDPTTIALRVTDTGATPEPPDPAYVQIIQGQPVAQFSTDEMLYEVMNPRSYSPYGLSPLESLILQAESALRGTLYNLSYFRENNIPEGFLTLPEDVAQTKTLVEEWQMWFDALVAGDPRMTHRLKILPGGSEYTPTKKPEDMAFEKFELWMLQQTCAMFEVQPQDIGITMNVNKATAGSQQDIGKERGLLPLGNFIKEIFDDLIQMELGLTNLQFIWRNINPTDHKEEMEIAEKEISLGALGVDEWRAENGREPLGLKPYIQTSSGPILVEDFVAGKVGPAATQATAAAMAENKTSPTNGNNEENKNNPPKGGEMTPEQKQKLMDQDIRRWKKCVYSDLERGVKIRTKFDSDYIDGQTNEEIADALQKVQSRLQAKLLFDQYLDPEIKASMTLLKFASELRRIEHDVASA